MLPGMDFLALVVIILAALPGLIAIRRRRGAHHGLPMGVRISLALVLLLVLARGVLNVYVDALWFREMGAIHRFWTEFSARAWSFTIGTIAAFVLLWVNAWLARRDSGSGPRLAPVSERHTPDAGRSSPFTIGGIDALVSPSSLVERSFGMIRLLDRVGALVLLIASLLLGVGFGANWWRFLLFLHRQPFGRLDPQFHRDIGFYVFTLPAVSALIGWLTGLVIACIVISAAFYVLPAALVGLGVGGWATLLRRGARHLAVLVGLLFWIGAVSTWVTRYELVYSHRGPLIGASAVNARLGATLLLVYMFILIVLGVGAAALGSRFRRGILVGFVGLWIGSAVLLLGVIPAAYETLAVKPEQLRAELPYIKYHLEMTREAFGLDSTHVNVIDLPDSRELTAAAVQAESSTVANLRLADWRPLSHTYNQLQTLRTYYRFADVDMDRYTFGGRPHAVMLSLRELDTSKVPERTATGGWDINRWFIYTHGYGLCMNSVNSFTAEGIPQLLIRDLPPVSSVPELTVKRPAIYFGELTRQPVLVHARGQQEFDYPRGDDNIFTTYAGSAGIPLGGLLSIRRLAFALRYHTINFFLSSYIGPETRILFFRDQEERLERLAPFLTRDRDPYPVLRQDGSLSLMRDLYTTADRYPYAATVAGVSYIRNSVKSVLDCYNGSVKLYVIDESDPLIRAYRAIYPDLFSPGATVPDDIRAHFRYPEDLIALQASIYGTFHVKDPVTFYNHEDVWETGTQVSEGQAQGTTVAVLPYYLLMRLPGRPRAEFLQMMPLMPREKDNMIAWVAGLADPGQYGKLVAYHLPKGTIAYGPRQIEARIDQNPTISRDLSLWNQQGSQVLRGNLLTVPMGGSFLYVEPLYLQATGGKIPELKRVIVATQSDVGYGSTFEDALGDLFGPSVARLAPPSVIPPLAASVASAVSLGASSAAGAVAGASAVAGRASSADHAALIRSAGAHLRRYQLLMGQGHAADAGAEFDALRRDLEALERQKTGGN
jgi:hypothetical protein